MTVREHIKSAHRIVIKLGTHVVTHDGVELALGRLMGLVEDMARLRRAGKEVILVSSGAVGMGMRFLGLKERPRSLGLRQACAAVGQGQLMSVYAQAFSQLGVTAAQVLLIQEDLADPDRALCLRTTLMRLLELGVVPILNENDSVSVRELVEHRRKQGETGTEPVRAFGDNDGLSAKVAESLDADLLILLTNVDGVFTSNPKLDAHARLIPEIGLDNRGVMVLTDGDSSGGTGGMAAKLEAAQGAAAEGVLVLIANGTSPHVLARALQGETLGTAILPAERRGPRWRKIAVSGQKRGALVANEGALVALRDRKASLLPIGVTAVEGEFEKGDLVEIRDGSGRVYGRGLVNYSASACRALLGRHSDEIDVILGYRGYDALVTRDNLVMG